MDPPTPEAVARAAAVRDGSVDLPVRDDVRSLVALREGAEMVVAVARSAAAWQDFWYAHVVEDVVLLEQVSSDGLHRFALLEAEELTRAVLGAAVHPDAGAAPTGGPVPVPAQTEDPTGKVPKIHAPGLIFRVSWSPSLPTTREKLYS